MRRSLEAVEQQWLDCIAHMGEAGAAAVQPLYGTQAGRASLGRGAGGDHSMQIDVACEEAMIAVLDREAPAEYSLVSEERGCSGDDTSPWRVVLDPLDGSLNAKRGLPTFSASIAVADGGTLGDVRVARVDDYLRPVSFSAVRGAGLLRVAEEGVTDEQVDSSRFETNTVELLLLEAGRPDRHNFRYEDLSLMAGPEVSADMRVRQVGSLALALCYVAVGIGDVLVAAVRSRSVDVAAGLLILREAGGDAAGISPCGLFDQPLDLEKRCAFVAWRAGLDGTEIVSRARLLEKNLTDNQG